ncbi:F-box/WD repeat-containing protein 7-like [Patiria miniata]|uniref:F-box domain-containing protein n=1 Tax=Patiria miniata TaxID=46514 RepID=A0A914ARW3_PATMI|nr:F-box/WD repeat-containing protein 7-like [Patiria miniata]
MADRRISGSDNMCESTTAASTGPLIYAVPDVLITTILQHLSASDLCHVASCCRWLRDATNQDSLWLPLCQSRGWERYGTSTDLAKIASFGPSKQAADDSAAGDDIVTFQEDRIVTYENTAGLTSTCRWKGVYMRANHLEKNWATNCSYLKAFDLDVEESPRHRTAHHERSRAVVDGDLLAIQSVSKEIHVYDIRNNTLQCVIPSIETAGLFKFRDGVIVVPFQSGVACAFDASTGKLLQTIDGNWRRDAVSLLFDGELVITYVLTFNGKYSDKFRAIYVWCVKDGKLIRILTVDPTGGDCVCYNMDYRDKMVAAAFEGDCIRVWDAKSGECVHTLKCPGEKSEVQLGDNVIVGFSTKGDECVTTIWSQDTGECQKVIHVGLPVPISHFRKHMLSGYNAELINSLILLKFDPMCCNPIRSVYAHNLRGEFITQLMSDTYVEKGNGSKRLFYVNDPPPKGEGQKTQNRVIFNVTPNGLVKLFDVDSSNQIIWIDDIRMITCDNKEGILLVHHYW